MLLINVLDTSLPFTNPVLKFLIILIIILLAPILLNKLRIPHILGLILAGAVIGPNGFNLLLRDSSIILSGTAGLLYIMFLAGLEIDLNDFKKNRFKSLLFGLYTFSIPMVFGILVGVYVLKFSILTSVLLASMFASHTLIAYPILGKFGVAKNRAVNIVVGGTMITDTLALLVLAIIVGMTKGTTNFEFWMQLFISVIVFGFIVLHVFPIVGRWFLKRYQDAISQYIFVLVMLFLGAFLAEIAGIEAIIGALLSGFALNRLIPSSSPLMNRIEFVGNAIFIPFFLIGVGMLLDFRAFFTDMETILVAVAMSVAVTLAKFIAAWSTQKTFKFSADERHLIFGLSIAHAAVTLATVTVGYNIIIGETATGEPIRLLGESILNGTIIMILITCTISTFVVQKGARNLSLFQSTAKDKDDYVHEEKIVIAVNNVETVEELINLSTILKSKENKNSLFALHVLKNNSMDANIETRAIKILDKALHIASATDNHLNKLLRYDLNIMNGILNVAKEQKATDLILGLHIKSQISESFLGNLTDGILSKCNATSFIYKSLQPISTIKRHIIIMPNNVENEIGFPFWLLKVWNIAYNTGAKLLFYGTEQTIKVIENVHAEHPIDADFITFNSWKNTKALSSNIRIDDNLIFILTRKDEPSYQKNIKNISIYLNRYLTSNSFILVCPFMETNTKSMLEFNNPSLLEPLEKLDELGKTIAGVFRKK
ncbi:Kef-type K+ transport system membrane component KefB [Mariniflexile fucanivorans]|uniref:Kef-type K+ transport system membrane component KefB n=1 Tax=Mariniflexile fucanivorans TaxID=264023 RepID=A0A4R1RLS8_9FLAO|nr:cation:proton antiporter [Mariniflexile fucanivorans]TCL67019.1 Kef-type K+ transport system membrane component KefB [Mariniflexile fucanivorans]